MKTKLTLGFLCFCLLPSALCVSAFAQGTAFNYQGRLNDGASAANGTYDLRFGIYDALSAGTEQGNLLTNSATAISNGLFTVTLEFGNQFPGADRWLEIGVRTNGGGGAFTTLTPRQKLTPTPYAITAEILNGRVSGGGLSGTYGSTVTMNNPANQFTGSFTGNGGGLTNVNAVTLGGLGASSFWNTGGNAGTLAGPNFIGTADNQPLELKVNGQRALRLEPTPTNGVVNVIEGSTANKVDAGVVGATIAGGGAVNPIQFITATNRVQGNYGTIGGGAGNLTSNTFSTVVGGAFNVASGSGATAMGVGSIASGVNSTAMGVSSASGDYSVAMGSDSRASGESSFAMGNSAEASGDRSTAMGVSTASGYESTAMGNSYAAGNNSTALGLSSAIGDLSFAAGRQAVANHPGAFVWADSQPLAGFSSTASDQFLIRAQGGVGIGLNNPASPLHVSSAGGAPEFRITQTTSSYYTRLRMDVSPGAMPSLGFWNSSLRMNIDYNGNVCATSFTPCSDRNLKENFRPVSPRDVLDKVAALPITRWNFKDDAGTTHVGPMAQDFYAVFNVGPDDRHIATVDADGVALAAIQGLNQKVEEKEAMIQEQETRIQNQAAKITELKQSVDELKKNRAIARRKEMRRLKKNCFPSLACCFQPSASPSPARSTRAKRRAALLISIEGKLESVPRRKFLNVFAQIQQ